MSNGKQINAELGGKCTVAPDGKGNVAITVNCRRDGTPAHCILTLEEAAQVHAVLEHLVLAGP